MTIKKKYVKRAMGLLLAGMMFFSAVPVSYAETPKSRVEFFGESGQKVIIENDDIRENQFRINKIQQDTELLQSITIDTKDVNSGSVCGSSVNYIHVHHGNESSPGACYPSSTAYKYNTTTYVSCGGTVYWQGGWEHYDTTRWLGDCAKCGASYTNYGGAGSSYCAKKVPKTVQATGYRLTCNDGSKKYGTGKIYNTCPVGGVKNTVLFASVNPEAQGLDVDYGIDVISYTWTGPSSGISGRKDLNYVEAKTNGTYTCVIKVKDKKTGTTSNITTTYNLSNLR